MTRILVCLAAALGMMTFSGCGEVQGGGAPVAPNTAALKPLPPAPEDKDVKIVPSPLAPSVLPPAGSSAAPADNGQPFGGSLSPSRADGGGGVLQGQFSEPPAQRGAAQGAGFIPGPKAPVETGEIALSRFTVTRVDPAHIHFEINYEFTKGEPNPSIYYAAGVSEVDANVAPANWLVGIRPFLGNSLTKSGTLIGEVAIGGTSPNFRVFLIASGTALDEKGQQKNWTSTVSNDIDATVGAGPGNASNGVSAATPPANGGGGLLQSLFGDTAPAKPPAANGSSFLPSTAPSDQPAHISLFGAAVTRINKDQLHYDFTYTFDQGKPNPTNWYTVVVEPASGSDGVTPPGEVKIEGKDLQANGKREGDVNMGGRSAAFAIHVTEGASREDRGHVISLIVVCAVHRNLEHLEPAAVGVGAQGKGYRAGMVTTPVSVYFAAKEMIVFNIKIPHGMQLFKALNNRNPNSQEEFMEKIIKDGDITLPELPAGQTFVYDPQTGELGVRHPEK